MKANTPFPLCSVCTNPSSITLFYKSEGGIGNVFEDYDDVEVEKGQIGEGAAVGNA